MPDFFFSCAHVFLLDGCVFRIFCLVFISIFLIWCKSGNNNNYEQPTDTCKIVCLLILFVVGSCCCIVVAAVMFLSVAKLSLDLAFLWRPSNFHRSEHGKQDKHY